MFEHFKVPQDLRPSDPRFGVGPSLIPVEHLQRLAQTGQTLLGTSHRREVVRQLVGEVQRGLKEYFSLPSDYEVVMGNGGATILWDMLGLGLVEKSSLHFTCGEFSEKWFKAHSLIPWIHARDVKAPYGEGIDVTEEEGYDCLCTTLNETSTGVQNTHVPQLRNNQTLVLMDATSGAGQIPIDFKRVDVCYFSPQKVFAAEGGLFIAIMSPKAIARAKQIQSEKGRFIPESFKWSHAIENSQQNQTYNTPNVANFFLLNEQIKLMNGLGQKKVIDGARAKADFIYHWAENKTYLSPFVRKPSYRSTTVATIDIDEKYSVDSLTKNLRLQGVAVDIEGYRKLGRNQLRLALFHNVTLENLEKLTKIISLGIEGLGKS